MKRVALGQPISEESLLRVAEIVGAASAAQQAIAEVNRRRASGEDVHIFWNRDHGILTVLTVGPMPKGVEGTIAR